LSTEKQLLREVHNRLFVDYETAFRFGELRDAEIRKLPEKLERRQRRDQLAAIRNLGFDQPYGLGDQLRVRPCRAERIGSLAMVSMPAK
jgi:hypothetical protein